MDKEKIKKIQEDIIKRVLDKYDLDLETEAIGEEINIIGAVKLTAKFATEETVKTILEEVEDKLQKTHIWRCNRCWAETEGQYDEWECIFIIKSDHNRNYFKEPKNCPLCKKKPDWKIILGKLEKGKIIEL